MAKSYWNMSSEELTPICAAVGIEYSSATRKEDIAKLLELDKANGEVKETIEEDEDGKIVEPKFDPKKYLARVIFHNTNDTDIPYVFVGLNGRSYYFPKDKEIVVPRDVLRVVDDAIEVRMVPRKVSTGGIIYDEKKIQRFPYTIKE